MIHVVTSCSLTMGVLMAHARRLGHVVKAPVARVRHLPHTLQATEADRVIAIVRRKTPASAWNVRTVVVATDEELVLLRLMRRVGEGVLAPADVLFHVLVRAERRHPPRSVAPFPTWQSRNVTRLEVGVTAGGGFAGPWGLRPHRRA